MDGGAPFFGAPICLISKTGVRYEGTLYTIAPEQGQVVLQNVRSYGTEGRGDPNKQVYGKDQIYEFIVFRASDIQDLNVLTPAPAAAPAPAPAPALPAQAHHNTAPFPGFPSTASPQAAKATAKKTSPWATPEQPKSSANLAQPKAQPKAQQKPQQPKQQQQQKPQQQQQQQQQRVQPKAQRGAGTQVAAPAADAVAKAVPAEKSGGRRRNRNKRKNNGAAAAAAQAAVPGTQRARPFNAKQQAENAMKAEVLPAEDFDFEESSRRFEQGQGAGNASIAKEDVVVSGTYDKGSSFFDDISSDFKDKVERSRNHHSSEEVRAMREQEKQRNADTFFGGNTAISQNGGNRRRFNNGSRNNRRRQNGPSGNASATSGNNNRPHRSQNAQYGNQGPRYPRKSNIAKSDPGDGS